MAPKTLWTDEYTLLCERCGYVVEGLATDGACPECGKPIAESLPERRVGTLWQQERDLNTLFATMRETLFSVGYTLWCLRADATSARSLRTATIVMSVVIAAWPAFALTEFTLRMNGAREPYTGFQSAMLWIAPLSAPLVLCIVLQALTWTEARGLCFLSARRGFRIDRTLANAICAHGCVGWFLASAGTAIGSTLLLASTHADGSTYEQGNEWVWLAYGMGLIITGGSLLLGFFFFELFAWLGLRRCKYANRARTGSGASNPSTPHP